MGSNNDRGVSLEGPLHTSLQSHFMKYYTLREKDNSIDTTNAERRVGILNEVTDILEES